MNFLDSDYGYSFHDLKKNFSTTHNKIPDKVIFIIYFKNTHTDALK